jgi:hypothetical protein
MNEELERMHAGKTNTNDIHYVNEMSITIMKQKEIRDGEDPLLAKDDWFKYIGFRIG